MFRGKYSSEIHILFTQLREAAKKVILAVKKKLFLCFFSICFIFFAYWRVKYYYLANPNWTSDCRRARMTKSRSYNIQWRLFTPGIVMILQVVYIFGKTQKVLNVIVQEYLYYVCIPLNKIRTSQSNNAVSAGWIHIFFFCFYT